MKRFVKFIIKAVYKALRGIYRVLPLTKSMRERVRGLVGRASVKLQKSIRYENPEDTRRACADAEVIGKYKAYVEGVFQTGKKCDDFIGFKKNHITFSDDDVKPIAFYLPQFYSFPENDEWWGKGFTEWTNVTKAVPQFAGHYQPHLPYDSTFYDLSNVDVIKKQVELARNYGIYGFCFHYYWFSGKRLLDKPLDSFLNTKEGLDFPFCINYANENWSRRWDGSDSQILIAQEHSDSDDLACITDICKYVRDERYIRINGKPLIIIYNAAILPDANKTIRIWREYCRESGIGEICLAGAQTFPTIDPLVYDFDEAVEFPPHFYHTFGNLITDKAAHINSNHELFIFDIEEYICNKRYYIGQPERMYKTVFPNWDNTARMGERATLSQSTPALYKKWLSDIISFTYDTRECGDRYVFINSWNEWAEGAHLEPCRRYGYSYLQMTADAILESREKANESPVDSRRIIFVSHDASPHGAQMLSLSIIKQLREVFKYNVFVILKTGGILLSKFAQYSNELLCIDTDIKSDQELTEWVKKTGASIAMCNTVVTGDVLKILSDCGVLCISMIHEMESAIRQYSCESSLSKIINHAKKITIPSGFVKDSVSRVETLPESNTVILPQGIYKAEVVIKGREECRREIRSLYGLSQDCKIVINVGYASSQKGVDLFARCAVRLCSDFKDCVFIWVGNVENGRREDVDKIISGTPAEVRVVLAGYQEEIYPFYLAADVFLLTSREDSFPSVAIEAMNYSLPVIAFEGGGGYVDVVLPDKTGYLTPMEDVEATSTQLVRLLSDDSLRIKMGRNAKESIKEIAHFNRYVNKLLSLLGEDYKKVSVIIPNYNYEAFLSERIESVLNQSYPVYEIIILDDASTDNSAEIIKFYNARYPLRIKAVYNERNSGSVFSQWEAGIKHASGDCIWIAESDDFADTRFLESLMDVMAGDDDIVLGYTQSKMIDENGAELEFDYAIYNKEVDSGVYKGDYISAGIDEIKNHLSVKNTILNVSSVVFKNTDTLLDLLGEAKHYKIAGDYRLYIDMLRDGGKLYYNAQKLNYHRRHTSSVSQRIDAQKHFDEICECQQYIADLYFNGELTDAAKKYREAVKGYLLT